MIPLLVILQQGSGCPAGGSFGGLSQTLEAVCGTHHEVSKCALQELQTQLTEQASLVKQERKRREAAERQQKKAQEEKVGVLASSSSFVTHLKEW